MDPEATQRCQARLAECKQACGAKEFTVLNEQVETDMLSCPHCQECVDVGDEEPEVEYED